MKCTQCGYDDHGTGDSTHVCAGVDGLRAYGMLDGESLAIVWAEIDSLRAELETERMRLAGCGVAAMSNTEDSRAQRIGRDSPYWSASYGDVCSMVDREMALRAELAESDALCERLSKILTATANALKGEPGPLMSHSWHDLAEKAAALRDELAALKAQEPVGTVEIIGSAGTKIGVCWKCCIPPLATPLYTRPVPAEPSEIADGARVIAWARDPNRKAANLAFTAGPERQAAYWIEWAQTQQAGAEPVAWASEVSGYRHVNWGSKKPDYPAAKNQKPLYAAPPVPAVPAGWLTAIDNDLVVAHLGVADASDSFDEARRKLYALINWHIAVATDPAVNGGWQLVPVEPMDEMLTVLDDCAGDTITKPRSLACAIWQEMVNKAPEAPATIKEFLRVAPAEEVERLRYALIRVQNFPSHPGGHPDDRSREADDPASWRHGWICAVEAMQDAALPVELAAPQPACSDCAAKQAKIDALMLEYCPDEMTPEQVVEWGENQKPASLEENEAIAKSLGYKSAACLCCGNHDTPRCVTCEVESDEPAEQSDDARDAARYRAIKQWHRAYCFGGEPGGMKVHILTKVKPDELDAAIDAAMAKGGAE